jgi:hypothetical protein
MYLSNRAGLLGVVLAVILGFQVDAHVPANRPGLETLGISVGALFLGLYGLTYDRCEVRGFLASYRANFQNVIAATAEAGWGTYDKEVVPGRRMAMFIFPVAFAPIPMFLLDLLDVAIRMNTHGTLTRAERFEFLEVPVACLGIWACHVFATRSLRRRVKPTTHESVHFGV